MFSWWGPAWESYPSSSSHAGCFWQKRAKAVVSKRAQPLFSYILDSLHQLSFQFFQVGFSGQIADDHHAHDRPAVHGGSGDPAPAITGNFAHNRFMSSVHLFLQCSWQFHPPVYDWQHLRRSQLKLLRAADPPGKTASELELAVYQIFIRLAAMHAQGEPEL